MATKARKKSFDCVAFQRAQRKKLAKELEGLSSAEVAAWTRNYRPTDPILRRFVERAERGTLHEAAVAPAQPEAASARNDNP